MIYLITGNPGTGKTLHMVSMLAKREDLRNRPLYIDGINELDSDKIPYLPMPEGCNGGNWHEWLPDGAILVVDECQRYWRARSNGSKVPEAVQAMETHRHKGVDIYLLSQKPGQLDYNLKALVGNHKHLWVSQLGTRRMFEWQRCANPDSKADVANALVRGYKLDKSAYNLYKSAEVHTKTVQGKSKWLWLMPVVLLATGGLSYWGYSQFTDGLEPEQTAAAPADAAPTGGGGGATAPHQTPGGDSAPAYAPPAEEVKTLKPEDFRPSMDGKPWTAPAYAPQNTAISTMPYPVACVKSGAACTCYTDQATPIRGMDKGLCIDFAENGIYNPYRTAAQSAAADKS